jgi:YVTN family beta-propeller protein
MTAQTVRIFILLLVVTGAPVSAQTTGATFGEVVRLSGTPSDVVLDEMRGRLYLVNSNANRVDVYDYNEKKLLSPMGTGTQPLAAAMSPDGSWLYVTNNGSATLTVLDLGTGQVSATVSLPARPEGVEVGFDGRALISTQGTGTNNLSNTLLIYDRTATTGQVTPVQFPPPPPTPTTLPQTFTRPVTTFRGKLIRTPDGQFIIGVSTINNNTQTILYVYEVASGSLLKSRTVTGQSTVLAMSPDGGRFMAGFTLYDTATLAVIAQQSTSNAPFPMPAAFNVLQNIGGSTFTPDGTTLYSAFNVAAFVQPAARPQSSILLVSDSRSLGISLGIKIPESIIAKMVMTSDGSQAWGLSESGLIYLPLATLYDFPILQPETTQVFLANDDCNRGIARATMRVNNLGKGKLTFSLPNTGSALIAQATSGLAPSSIVFTMDPGRSGVVRQAGTNLSANAGLTGFPINVNLASNEAINIPNTVRVYMNYRQSDMRGLIVPVPVSLDNAQGLLDLQADEDRGRIYVANSGYNRIEVYDTKKQKLLPPIDVCQLPRQMAVSPDGYTMYVACQGSEGISIVDLDAGAVTGMVEFPPIPRAGNANPVTPRSLAVGLSGLQFVASNGTLWKVVGNQAVPRDPSTVVGVTAAGAQTPVSTPAQMLASPDYKQIILLGANGAAYLYDALADAYTSTQQLFSTPLISYFGPLGVAKDSGYMLANGLILNSSLTVIGGAERPGTVQTTPPAGPGQPPTVTVVSAGQRNVAAVAPVDANYFVRLTTPVRNSITAVTRDEARTTMELVDVRSGAEQLLGVVPENPVSSVFGQQLSRISPRMMLVDSPGTTSYTISLSGISIVPLVQSTTATRPVIPAGARGIVNSTDGSQNIRPGSFITVTGQNLGAAANADQVPLPTVLGGSCVVFNDVPVQMIQSSPTQLSAQVPDTLRPGTYVVQVRSLATAQASEPLVLNLQKP